MKLLSISEFKTKNEQLSNSNSCTSSLPDKFDFCLPNIATDLQFIDDPARP